MIQDPEDIFGQMDAMIARMMAAMGDELMAGRLPAGGFHIVIESGGLAPDDQGPAAIPTVGAVEPVPEVHRIGDEIKVVVGLPGVTEENLNLRLSGRTLAIDASGDLRTYHTSAELPAVDPQSLSHSIRNGVLEVTLRAAQV